jgi:hypothetical protein
MSDESTSRVIVIDLNNVDTLPVFNPLGESSLPSAMWAKWVCETITRVWGQEDK